MLSARETAAQLQQHYLVDDHGDLAFPVDIYTLLSQHDITLHIAALEDHVLCLGLQEDSNSAVEFFVNDHLSPQLQRVWCAYLFAQYLSHEKTAPFGVVNNEQKTYSPWVHACAQELLMPAFAVRHLWAQAYSVRKIAKFFDIPQHLVEHRIAGLGLF